METFYKYHALRVIGDVLRDLYARYERRSFFAHCTISLHTLRAQMGQEIILFQRNMGNKGNSLLEVTRCTTLFVKRLLNI